MKIEVVNRSKTTVLEAKQIKGGTLHIVMRPVEKPSEELIEILRGKVGRE